MRCDGVDWIHLVQDREKSGALANTVLNLEVKKKMCEFFDLPKK
jgi:hypothetical protein